MISYCFCVISFLKIAVWDDLLVYNDKRIGSCLVSVYRGLDVEHERKVELLKAQPRASLAP